MTFIIAEIGVNHQNDLDLARWLIDAAAEVGADAVKFQTYDAEKLDPPGPRRDMLKKLQLSREAHFRLKSHADQRKVEFISTPFDVDSLRFLVDDLGVKTLKIASGNLDNWPLLEAADKANVSRILVSTGGATIEEAVTAYDSFSRWRPTMMHCVSCYPAPVEATNLGVLATMRRTFGEDIGFSDHTMSMTLPVAAVALGAVVIEKHLTMDRDAEGPDHKASLEPHQFKLMVKHVREVEQAMGNGVKAPHPCEAQAMAIAEERRKWRAL